MKTGCLILALWIGLVAAQMDGFRSDGFRPVPISDHTVREEIIPFIEDTFKWYNYDNTSSVAAQVS